VFRLLDGAEALYTRLSQGWEAFKGNPAVWIGEHIEEIYQKVLPEMMSALDEVNGLLQKAAEGLGQWSSDVEGGLGAFDGLELGVEGLQAIVDAIRDTLTGLSGKFAAAGKAVSDALIALDTHLTTFYEESLRPLLDILVGLGLVIITPPPVKFLLAAEFVVANLFRFVLPDCYKVAICEFLIDLCQEALAFLPEPKSTDLLGILIKAGAQGFLDQLKQEATHSPERLVGALNLVASVLGGNAELWAGFLWGLVVGVWDATAGTVLMILQLGALPFKFMAWLATLPFKIAWVAYKKVDDWAYDREVEGEADSVKITIGDLHRIDQPIGEGSDGEVESPWSPGQEPQHEADKPAEQEVDTPDTTLQQTQGAPPDLARLAEAGVEAFHKTLERGLTRPELEQLLGIAQEVTRQHAHAVGAGAAKALLDAANGGLSPFAVGQVLGELAALVLIEVILALLGPETIGITWAIDALLALQKTAKFAKLGKGLAAGIRVIEKVINFLRPALKKIGGMDNLIGRWAKRFEQGLDESLDWLKKGKKKVDGDADPDSDKGEDKDRGEKTGGRGGTGRRHDKPDGDGGDSSGDWADVRKTARRAARAGLEEGKKETDEEALTETAFEQRFKPKLLKKPTIGVDYEIKATGSSWKVIATATRRGPSPARSSYQRGDGWIATDKNRKPYFVHEDKTNDHKKVIDNVDNKVKESYLKSIDKHGSDDAKVFAETRKILEDFAKVPEPKLLNKIELRNETQTLSEARKDDEYVFDVVVTPNLTEGKVRTGQGPTAEDFEEAFNAVTDELHKAMQTKWGKKLSDWAPLFSFDWSAKATERLDAARTGSRADALAGWNSLKSVKNPRESLKKKIDGKDKKLHDAFHAPILGSIVAEIHDERLLASAIRVVKDDATVRELLQSKIHPGPKERDVLVDLPVALMDFESAVEPYYGEMDTEWITNIVREHTKKEFLSELSWTARSFANSDGKRVEPDTFKAAVRDGGKATEFKRLLIRSRGTVRHTFFEPFGESIVKAIEGIEAFAEYVRKNLPDTKIARYDVDQGKTGGVGRLTLAGAAEGVNPELQAAVESASYDGQKPIVSFMLLMAVRRECNGITFAEFNDPSNPVGFEYKLRGTTQNKAWFKDKFRAADSGKHEWIPSSNILDVIARANQASDATQAARWVYAQHWLRSETSAIIFKPGDYRETYDAVKDNDEEAQNAMAAEFKASDLNLQGHVGALYIHDTNIKKDPIAKTVGSDAWHDVFRAIFNEGDSIDQIVSDMEKQVKEQVWDGQLKFLPEWMEKMADELKSDYVGSTGKRLAETLKGLGKHQKKNYDTIINDFEVTKDKLFSTN